MRFAPIPFNNSVPVEPIVLAERATLPSTSAPAASESKPVEEAIVTVFAPVVTLPEVNVIVPLMVGLEFSVTPLLLFNVKLFN